MQVTTTAPSTPFARPRVPAAEAPAPRGDTVELSGGPPAEPSGKALAAFAISRGGGNSAFQGRVTRGFVGPLQTSPLGNAQAVARQMQEGSGGQIKVHDVKLVNGVPMISFQAAGRNGPSECRMLVADSAQLQAWGGKKALPQDVARREGALAAVNGTFSGPEDNYPVGDIVGSRRLDAQPIPRLHSYITQSRQGGEWSLGLARPTGHTVHERYTNGTEKEVNTYDVPNGVRRASHGLMAGGAPLLVNGQDVSRRLDHRDHARVNPQSFTDNVARADTHVAVGFTRSAQGRQQVLLLTTDANLDLPGAAGVFQAAGARDAMALDGGHATEMTAGNRSLDFTKEHWPVPSALLIKPRQ